MNETHVDDQLDLYALGALELNEQAEIDEHLDGCARCRARLDEAKRLVALLAWTPEQQNPPPALRDKVLRSAKQQNQERRAKGWWQQLDPGPWRWTRPRRMLGIAIAAAAVIFALLGNTAVLQQRLGTAQATVTQQAQRLVALENAAQQQQQVVDVLRSPGARLVVLAPQTQSASAGQLLVNRDGTQGYLVTDALPTLPSDKDYQLWLIKDNTPISAGVFRVDNQGTATFVVNAAATTGGYQVVGISVEPAGGSSQPTQVVLLGEANL